MKENKKISLVTYVISLIAIACLCVGMTVFVFTNKKENSNQNQVTINRVESNNDTEKDFKKVDQKETTNQSQKGENSVFVGSYTRTKTERTTGNLDITNVNEDSFNFFVECLYIIQSIDYAPSNGSLKGEAKKIGNNKYLFEEKNDADGFEYRLYFDVLESGKIELKDEGKDENGKTLDSYPFNGNNVDFDGIYFLDKNNTSNNLVDTEEKETINNNQIKNENGKLIQFDTKFHELKEVAKEYRDTLDVKNYKDFVYDLDGDGKTETITLKRTSTEIVYGYEEAEFTLSLNGTEFVNTEKDDFIGDANYVYIVDLNKNDNSIELIWEGYGPGDISNYVIFSLKNSKMEKISSDFSGWTLKIDEFGKIVQENALISGLNPEIYTEYYEFENGKINKKELNLNVLKNVDFNATTCFTEDKANIQKYINADDLDQDWEKGLNKYGIIINKKLNFKILEYDNDENFAYGCFYVKLDDGKTGYIFSLAYNLAG